MSLTGNQNANVMKDCGSKFVLHIPVDQRAAVLAQACSHAFVPNCAVVNLVAPSSSKITAANASRRGQGLR
jgi:hypothetical protein